MKVVMVVGGGGFRKAEDHLDVIMSILSFQSCHTYHPEKMILIPIKQS